MIGYGTPDRRPCHRCTSVPQTSENAVRISAPPGGRSGSRSSRISTGRCGAGMTAARTARDMAIEYLAEAPRTMPHTIASAAADLRQGRVTSVALVEASLDAIDRDQERTNAFITIDADGARSAARLADHERGQGLDRGPLH